jgi:hypothetical protein
MIIFLLAFALSRIKLTLADLRGLPADDCELKLAVVLRYAVRMGLLAF